MTAHALPPHAQLIARGLSAEVYAWDADTVLKLFLPHVSPFSADYEANCSAALITRWDASNRSASGAPSQVRKAATPAVRITSRKSSIQLPSGESAADR